MGLAMASDMHWSDVVVNHSAEITLSADNQCSDQQMRLANKIIGVWQIRDEDD